MVKVRRKVKPFLKTEFAPVQTVSCAMKIRQLLATAFSSVKNLNYMPGFLAAPMSVTSTSSKDVTISFTVSLYFLK